jgi:hypothetical protein
LDHWQKLGDVTARITHKLSPVCLSIVLPADLAAAVRKEAIRTGHLPDTIIAEAVRSYVGDAA